ncbi:hypothetical protein [Pseudoduganella sp. UC29_71]|uniref:hypothetical protein n=1 Tax=Pseudoduganella sp. UC29_71 TaxID=3350174 RepID=UPI00366F97A1
MRDVILTATFDIDQDSQLLRWSFTADGKPISGQGVETGLLAFKLGDNLTVVVQARSEFGRLKQVDIQSCNLITMPRAFTKRENPERAGEFPEPSPFGDQYAVVDLGNGICDASGASSAIWHAPRELTCDNLGRWELSFIITTNIIYTDGEVERRVFAFDPECDVGTGL